MDTFRDEEFLADAGKAKLEIAPVPGEQIQALVHQIYATPAEIAQKTAALIQ